MMRHGRDTGARNRLSFVSIVSFVSILLYGPGGIGGYITGFLGPWCYGVWSHHRMQE